MCLGLTLALLPPSGKKSFTIRPRKLLAEVADGQSYFTVDQVARFIISDDTTVQLIDLRPAEEFRSFNIPGSINIPFKEFISINPLTILDNGKLRNIFYSNGDFDSNYALVFAKGMNYPNVYIMKGGLNEWFNSVMYSSFSGDRISPKENSLFENRIKARNMFTEINSLPDSLKMKFISARNIAVKKLDGGCE